MELLQEWAGLAGALIAIAASAYNFLTAGSKENAEKIDEICDDIVALEKRVQAIEGEMKHLPDRKSVHDLQLTLKDIQIEMAGIKATTELSSRATQRVEAWLLENNGNGRVAAA